jgi:hypothetical protein
MSVPLIVKRILSGSTNGRNIAITATSSPGTLIHTAQPGTVAGSYDEVWLWVVNNSSQTVDFVLQFGGTGSSDATSLPIPATSGPVLIAPGLPLQNSLVVRAYASSSSACVVQGYVNRLTA